VKGNPPRGRSEPPADGAGAGIRPPAGYRGGMRRLPLLALALLLLAGCQNDESPLPDWMRASPENMARVPLPGQYASSNPADRGSLAQRQEEEESGPTEAELRAEMTRRSQVAHALWQAATQTGDPEEAADLFDEIAEEYPEYPRAAEARFRQGQMLYRIQEWTGAIDALQQYMELAPVNPYMAQTEELLYRSGIGYVEESHGILEPFTNDDDGLNALRYVAATFPAGEFADDALLYLGRYYQEDGELDTAALYYKELLMRYPDSEWSFRTRRLLAETYVARDQGDNYHSGFVDRDPREEVPDDPRAEAHAGPVKSSLELAIEQYDRYLERIARDPGRRAEYAAQVAEVRAAKRAAQEQLAAKDDRIAAWYAGRGDQAAADVYRRSAARWRGGANTSPVPTVQAPPAPATSAPAPVPPAPQPTRPVLPVRPRPPAAVPSAPVPPTSLPPRPPVPGTTTTLTRPAVPPPPPPPAWPPDR
jgi:TolA-binding protein